MPIRGPLMKPAPKGARKPPLNSDTPTGLMLNKRELRSIKAIAEENRKAEFMYLRENEFTAFDLYNELPQLKVLDLSINNLVGDLQFVANVPNLRHLYLTGNRISSLEGIAQLEQLETLCLSDNELTSFAGLSDMPSLRVLSLNFNQLQTFRQFPFLPELHTINLIGNPIAETPSYRKMGIAVCSSTLQLMDTTAVTEEERAEVEFYRGKVVYCINEGMVVEGDQPEEQADAFMLKVQRESWPDAGLSLQAVNLAPIDTSTAALTESKPVTLNVCLQDKRPLALRRDDVFHSRFLYPVAFKVDGDAQEVFVVGAMNRWQDPIAMERCEEDGAVFFQTTLYLPAGDYEYRYIVDGQERVSDELTTSKYGQGPCNVHHVQPSTQPPDDDEQTVLFFRWLRCNESNGFDLIENENSMSYVPGKEDVGQCLRAEVLAYVNGQFSFLYFDISAPVAPGPPKCEKLEILGTAAEGDTLTVEADYSGGVEGNSLLQWIRVFPDGKEEPIDLVDPWAGYNCTLEDVGKKILVEYTPIRVDNEAGEKVSAMTDDVTAGIPGCRKLEVTGELIEGALLTALPEYTGGFEGASVFHWFRHDQTADAFAPIDGACEATYTPTVADLGRVIAVEYTPVSEQEIVGEPVRCVLDGPIQATFPGLKALRVTGRPEEQHVLMVEYDYIGGHFGVHQIQWFVSDDAAGTNQQPLGRANIAAVTLTAAEVGKFVSVQFTPVREDGVCGETAMAVADGQVTAGMPQLRSMDLDLRYQGDSVADAFVGCTATAVFDYFGGEAGDHIVEWAREAAPGVFEPVSNQPTYAMQPADDGATLRVSVTPVRCDGVTGDAKTRTVAVGPAPAGATPAASATPAGATPAASVTPAGTPAAVEAHDEEEAQVAAPARDEDGDEGVVAAPARDASQEPSAAATPSAGASAVPTPAAKEATPVAATPSEKEPTPVAKEVTPAGTPAAGTPAAAEDVAAVPEHHVDPAATEEY